MLKQQIQSDANGALKSGSQEILGVLRLALTAINSKEKEKRYNISKTEPNITEEELVKKSELTDEEIINTLSSEVKKRRDAITLYEKGNRPELVDKEKKEIETLQKYLPEQISGDELKKLIEESIQKVGAKEIKDMGRIMADLMPKVKGRADGSEISRIIKELLKKITMEKLIPIGNLFNQSFTIYNQNGWTFTKLILINFLTLFISLALSVAFFLLSDSIYSSIILSFLGIVIFLTVVIITFWVQVSMIFVIKEMDNKLSIKQILLTAWPYLGSFAWVLILVSLAVLGGLVLFIIPGIIFAVWFLFSRYILIFEDKKGISALKESRRLVQGNWWGVFGRLLIIGILASIISYIPFLGSLINMFFIVPFVAIYNYLIYKDLKRIQTVNFFKYLS